MPSHRIEEQLAALKMLQAAAPTPAGISTLRKALADRVNLVVARAAQVAAEMEQVSLLPDLAKAFERLFENSKKTDPQCWGKNSVAKALKDLGLAESALFLRGMRHVQMEPVWGGEADTAVTLRATCCLALVQCSDIPRDGTLRALVDALTDDLSELPERSAPVRIEAVRALEQMEGEEVVLTLRLKARLGDVTQAVTGQVFESLLQLEGTESVDFIASFLDHSQEEIQEEAALALGVSRLASALDVLKLAWEKYRNNRPGETILRAISSARTEPAIDFLLDVVRKRREREALEALRALALHLDSGEICRRVIEAAHSRTEPAIESEIQRQFKRKSLD